MKRLLAFLESLVFAGLRPGVQKTQSPELKWLGPIRGPVERFLSGGAHSDPLYLTNRTLGKKIWSWTLIAVPCLVLALAIGVTLSRLFDPPAAKPSRELSSKEIAAKLLPDMDKEIKLATNPDVQVVEVGVHHDGGSRLVGVIRNMSTHEIGAVDLVIDLADSTGTQLGAVTGTVEKLPASSTKEFHFAIKQRAATLALVREINSR